MRVLAKVQSNSDEIIGQDFNFVTGRGTSVAQLAELVKEVCGSASKIEKSDPKYFDVQKFIGNPEKCSRILNFRLQTTLEEGLRTLRDRLAPTLQNESKKTHSGL
jgi:nucleoside-diphosphate-sugar epimerase